MFKINFFRKSIFGFVQIIFLIGIVSFFCPKYILAQSDNDAGACGNNYSGGGTTSCFLSGTLIQMEDGKQKKIEEIKVGDKVRGYDLENDSFTDNIVEELESPIRTEWFEINLDNGKTIKTTSEHPIYVKEYEGWASINPEATRQDTNGKMVTQSLLVGQHVFGINGIYSKIVSIKGFSGRVQTYNLKKVSDNNTFFAEGALVHNKGDDSGVSPTPICSPWSSWSPCVGPCGSTGTQTRTCSIPPSEWGGGIDYTETQSCTTSDCACTPNCACSANTCIGSFCADGCGGTCSGTLIDTVWSPDTSKVCSGVSFIQTGNFCGLTRTAVGTKTCLGGNCIVSGTSCTGNFFNVYSDWYSNLCSGGICSPVLTIPGGCNFSQNCGTEICTDSSVWREKCKDGDIYEFQWGKDDSCSTTTVAGYSTEQLAVFVTSPPPSISGCDTDMYHECPGTERLKENCEAETVCKMIDDDAECTTRTSQWTEN